MTPLMRWWTSFVWTFLISFHFFPFEFNLCISVLWFHYFIFYMYLQFCTNKLINTACFIINILNISIYVSVYVFFTLNMFLNSQFCAESIGFIMMCFFFYKCIAEEIKDVGETYFFLRSPQIILTHLRLQSLVFHTVLKLKNLKLTNWFEPYIYWYSFWYPSDLNMICYYSAFIVSCSVNLNNLLFTHILNYMR